MVPVEVANVGGAGGSERLYVVVREPRMLARQAARQIVKKKKIVIIFMFKHTRFVFFYDIYNKYRKLNTLQEENFETSMHTFLT